KERTRLEAERLAAVTQVTNLESQIKKSLRDDERISLRGQQREAEIKARSAADQIQIIDEELETMIVRAPHDGIVTTWETKKNLLGRPVEVGQELITIAATSGEWVLEVEVPDDDMAPVLAAHSELQARIKSGQAPPDEALGAYFVSATDPEHRYHGFVRRIASKAETVEGKHVVKVTVGFSDAVRNDFLSRNQELRPGAEVRARIQCGDARLAYVLFRDVIQVFYETVLFRWPFLT
ncbi:MAG TPA: HlyD family secretion protein, partial [Isosphaeraceae bacterium]